MTCTLAFASRRRLFWATQPDACGVSSECETFCGTPGLSFVDPEPSTLPCNIAMDPGCPPPVCDDPPVATISTENWIRGLAINILMTDGRKPDTTCGYKPGTQGGHWSESYTGGTEVGSLIRAAPATGSTNEAMRTVAAYAKASLDRLVQYGVASSVEVKYEYIGNLRMALNVTIYGTDGSTSNVGMTGERVANSWIWS